LRSKKYSLHLDLFDVQHVILHKHTNTLSDWFSLPPSLPLSLSQREREREREDGDLINLIHFVEEIPVSWSSKLS
jgi:hypothetical protein